MNAPRHPESAARPPAAESLSSFLDGECQPDAADEACRRWKNDPEWRRNWHAYHVIGDVLRSDELSPSRPADAAFLDALRARLAAEPVPLAPAPLRQPSRRWLAPAAMVAGVMVVGVTMVALRPGVTGPATGWDAQIAATPPAGRDAVRQVSRAAAPVAAAGSGAMALDGQVIRDARLDAYFEAHRGAVATAPTAMPGALRSVDILVPRR